MNLILLSRDDFTAEDTVSLTGRRLRHALEILKPRVNDRLTVGLEGGMAGSGRVTAVDSRALTLQVSLTESPPVKIPVILCIALMRPIVLKRVLLTAASLGVEEIVLFHSAQVEKSFWQSTSLAENEIREQLILGLEQSKDTILPKVSFQKRFKPFAEDMLPGLLKGRRGVVADPSGCALTGVPRGPMVLLIGPEGGFVPYEVDKLREAGCQAVSLGPRILKVETAVVVLLSKLF